VRRRAVHEREGHQQEGSLALGLRAACTGPAPRRRDRADAEHATSRQCSPPTPPRCSAKSILGRRTRHRHAGGRTRRARHARAAAPTNEALIRARVTQLWQTRMLRTARLDRGPTRSRERAVVLPGDLPARDPAPVPRPRTCPCRANPVAPFLRMGHGSAATATAIPTSRRHAAQRAGAPRPRWRCASDLTEGARTPAPSCPMFGTLAPVSARKMAGWPQLRPTTMCTAPDEPYRRCADRLLRAAGGGRLPSV